MKINKLHTLTLIASLFSATLSFGDASSETMREVFSVGVGSTIVAPTSMYLLSAMANTESFDKNDDLVYTLAGGAQISSYVLTTLVVLLKTEKTSELLARAEEEGVIFPELRSILINAQAIYANEGIEVTEDQVLEKMYQLNILN